MITFTNLMMGFVLCGVMDSSLTATNELWFDRGSNIILARDLHELYMGTWERMLCTQSTAGSNTLSYTTNYVPAFSGSDGSGITWIDYSTGSVVTNDYLAYTGSNAVATVWSNLTGWAGGTYPTELSSWHAFWFPQATNRYLWGAYSNLTATGFDVAAANQTYHWFRRYETVLSPVYPSVVLADVYTNSVNDYTIVDYGQRLGVSRYTQNYPVYNAFIYNGMMTNYPHVPYGDPVVTGLYYVADNRYPWGSGAWQVYNDPARPYDGSVAATDPIAGKNRDGHVLDYQYAKGAITRIVAAHSGANFEGDDVYSSVSEGLFSGLGDNGTYELIPSPPLYVYAGYIDDDEFSDGDELTLDVDWNDYTTYLGSAMRLTTNGIIQAGTLGGDLLTDWDESGESPASNVITTNGLAERYRCLERCRWTYNILPTFVWDDADGSNQVDWSGSSTVSWLDAISDAESSAVASTNYSDPVVCYTTGRAYTSGGGSVTNWVATGRSRCQRVKSFEYWTNNTKAVDVYIALEPWAGVNYQHDPNWLSATTDDWTRVEQIAENSLQSVTSSVIGDTGCALGNWCQEPTVGGDTEWRGFGSLAAWPLLINKWNFNYCTNSGI
jgi:hypothetical protein